MTNFRTSPIYARGFFTLVTACALAGAAIADPIPSRDYPPTYSNSRKDAWYDPLGLLSSSDKKSSTPSAPVESKPIPSSGGTPIAINQPAWKWYGYGTPTPGQNLVAPNVPGSWYTSSGATAGAVPHSQVGASIPGVVPDPIPSPRGAELRPFGKIETLAPPDNGPRSTTIFADVDWQSVPARLRVPTNPPNASEGGPHATLKAPVPVDDPIAPSAPTGPAIPVPAAAESPDLPVEAAPGIVPPQISRINRPMVTRGTQPDLTIADVIRRACGSTARIMEVAEVGPKRLIIRMSGNAEGARDRIARLPQLAGWNVEIERVTALRP